MLVAVPLLSVTGAEVNNAGPVPVELLYRLNVTVPVGLSPPDTAALSAIEPPTVADPGSWIVLIDGVASGTV